MVQQDPLSNEALVLLMVALNAKGEGLTYVEFELNLVLQRVLRERRYFNA